MKLYLDFEATGLDTKSADIIQIGAVLRDETTSDVYTFESLVHTPKTISTTVYEITKINNEMLESAPSFHFVIKKFQTWLNERRTTQNGESNDISVIAYNGLKYDILLMCHQLSQNNIDIGSYFKNCGIISFVDPLVWARNHLDRTILLRNKKGNSSFRLGDIYKSLFGKSFENAHNAVADSLALMKICEHNLFTSMKFDINQQHTCGVKWFMMRNKFLIPEKNKKYHSKSLLLSTKRKVSPDKHPLQDAKRFCI